MGAIEIAVDPRVRARVRIGTVEVRELDPDMPMAALDTLIATETSRLCAVEAGKTAGQIERLGPARTLYRAFGIDPTRHRPSPEALVRRVLRGESFPRVHPAVDLANLWAIVHGLPVGLYDLRKLAPGEITLREGRAGEVYEGIRRGEIHLEGRPVLADAQGAFGNPTADSLRTSVDGATREALAVLFAPADHDERHMAHWLAWLVDAGAETLGARASWELGTP